jgi:hypothetical protein
MRTITTSSGLRPQGAPFVTWSSLGGVNGTIVVSDSTTNSLFVNQALGEGVWKVVKTTAGRAYGREVRAGRSLRKGKGAPVANDLQFLTRELSALLVVRRVRDPPKISWSRISILKNCLQLLYRQSTQKVIVHGIYHYCK